MTASVNAILRHLSLRLWATAFAGTLIGVIVLPWWQGLFGVSGLLLPLAALFVACYWVAGWSMDKIGVAHLRRLVNEAAVWERAGMTAEAEAAFQKALTVYDSFWLSPLHRRRRTPWFTARLARFYITQSIRNPYADTMVKGYLFKHPDDTEVASTWLEQLLSRNHPSRVDFEVAARIGEALVDDVGIQQLLMQFHLANARADFHAVQTYRRVWEYRRPLPQELLKPLAELLARDGWLTHWALRVYMEAFQGNCQEALEGIAGCAYWLQPTVENRSDLAAAKTILERFDKEHVAAMARRFKPASSAGPPARQTRRPAVQYKRQDKATKPEIFGAVAHIPAAIQAAVIRIWRGAGQKPAAWSAAVGVTLGLCIVILVVVGRRMVVPDSVEPPATETVAPVEPPPEVNDPFTIQVAAYLKGDDAQLFVDQLKQHGLDAFWTEATSANRKWYQVKVSHFRTKDLAMQYGQELKSKGLIDDYYVANFGKK